MAAKTVLNYLPRESVIHKLTGTTKLAFFLLFTFASMITYNTWVLLVLLAVSLAAFKLSRIRFREVRFMLVFMLVFLLLNNLFIFLFDPDQGTTLYGTRTVLCHLFWRYDLTAEQLFYMCNISLKYFVALPVAILFISATDPSEFAASLNSIGISYKVGYSVAIALRYIPDIQRDYHSISQAHPVRAVLQSVCVKSRRLAYCHPGGECGIIFAGTTVENNRFILVIPRQCGQCAQDTPWPPPGIAPRQSPR